MGGGGDMGTLKLVVRILFACCLIAAFVCYVIEFIHDQRGDYGLRHWWFNNTGDHSGHAGFIFLFIFILIFLIIGAIACAIDVSSAQVFESRPYISNPLTKLIHFLNQNMILACVFVIGMLVLV